MGNPLRDRNDEIYRRWKAGENYLDLANEFNRWPSSIEIMVYRRGQREARKDDGYVPGPSNKQRREANRERDASLIRDRKDGLSWRKLGDKHKLSPERCRQIYLKHLRQNEPEAYREWTRVQVERARTRAEVLHRFNMQHEKYREHHARVRVFDREEDPAAVAAELGWTMEKMTAFIAEARKAGWVTETEYRDRRIELLKKWLADPVVVRPGQKFG